MDVSTCLSMSSNTSIQPLKNDSNIAALKTFEEIIKTCLGPFGKLKTIQNASGGHVTVTSSSQKLFYLVSVRNTFLKLIVSSTKAHLNYFSDCGLCCSLLSLRLINNSLSKLHSLALMGKLYEYFGKIFIDLLTVDMNSCIFKMDFSNLIHLRSIVQAILKSKPSCMLRQTDLQHLIYLLTKAHLSCIPSNSTVFYHKNINFISLEGASCDKSSIYEGLLIRLFDMPLKNLNFLNIPVIKIVLFTSSLSGDADFPVNNIEVSDNVDVWEVVLKSMKDAIEKIIKCGVHILACQKVVHPSIKKQLERASILVLDRLGYETSRHLEYLSGSSNSSLFHEPVFGYVSCLNKVTIGRNDFLVLTNDSRPFWTILICNFNEQAVNETKIVCQQVIDTLFRLLQKPILCFGAGCTEVHTSKLLEQKVVSTLEDIQKEVGCTISQILEALHTFTRSISDLAIAIHQGSFLNFVTESVYGHLWKLKDGNFPSESDRCLCGQLSAAGIDNSNWEFFSRSVNSIKAITDFRPEKTVKQIESGVILDELSSKRNAYSVAFETASLLLRVSVSVCS